MDNEDVKIQLSFEDGEHEEISLPMETFALIQTQAAYESKSFEVKFLELVEEQAKEDLENGED